MKIYNLVPNDSHKSFYGKAKVRVWFDGSETLYSYDTPIIKRHKDGHLERLWGGWSATTGRHVRAFCGLNKKEILSLPHEPTTYEKAHAYSGTLY